MKPYPVTFGYRYPAGATSSKSLLIKVFKYYLTRLLSVKADKQKKENL